MKNLETSIEIAASPSQVWKVLTDFAAYADWNPFIISSVGEPVVGTRLRNGMLLGDRPKPQYFNPKVLVADADRELRWLGSLFFRGLFDGEHYFILEPLGSGSSTRLVQGENFSGILSGLIMGMIASETEVGFRAMNEALKKRAENL